MKDSDRLPRWQEEMLEDQKFDLHWSRERLIEGLADELERKRAKEAWLARNLGAF